MTSSKYAKRRAESAAWQHLYDTKTWKVLRAECLYVTPWCVLCAQRDIYTPATVVDHIKPHKGDEALFFNFDNLQSLCKACHDRHKQRAEKRKDGLIQGADATGTPTDPNHHWNR